VKTSLRRDVLRSSAAAAFAAVLSLASTIPAHAGDTLDQFVPSLDVTPQSTTFLQVAHMAQTFTPSVTDSMDRVQLYIGSGNISNPTFRLEVWRVDTSKASLTGLGTPWTYQEQLNLPNNARRGWQSIPLNPTVPVQANTVYALVLSAVSLPLELRWYYMSGWNYSGDAYCCTATLTKDTTKDFAFQTYRTGVSAPPPVNAPPKIDATTAAVQTPEGSAPTNAGTYSDPESGDTVHLSSTTGSVNWTGTSSGTWTWTGTAADEEAPKQTVTITADDGHNPGVPTTFTVSFYAMKPSVTVTPTGATATALAAATKPTEGTLLSFTGQAVSPDAADNSAGFNYAWSVTKDGAPYQVSSLSTTSFGFTPNDEGDYVITMTATDDGNMTGSGSTEVAIGDVLPTAVITGFTPALTSPGVVLPNEWVTFSGTFVDPGTGDPHSASWDFGDGTSASGWTVTHFYTEAKSYTVTLTVSQGEDPGVGTAQTTVVVLTPEAALAKIAGDVQGLSGLNAGQKSSLIAKLDAASASAGRGDTKTATNQLNAFLNELAADARTGKVSDADAASLEGDIRAVKGALGDYNPFLDFWPLGL
jgi:hypothetical protein